MSGIEYGLSTTPQSSPVKCGKVDVIMNNIFMYYILPVNKHRKV